MATSTDHETVRRQSAHLRWSGNALFFAAVLLGVILMGLQFLGIIDSELAYWKKIRAMLIGLIFLSGACFAGFLVRLVLDGFASNLDLLAEMDASNRKTATAIESEIVPSLDRLLQAVRERPAQSSSGAAGDVDWSRMATRELQEQLKASKVTGKPEQVLDLRDVLRQRLSSEKMQKLDAELAQWFSKFYFKALRRGKAGEIADSLTRAVESLAGNPEMKHLEEALPFILQSAELKYSIEEDK